MVRMTCLGNTDFYIDRKRDAILPTLLKQVKDSKAYRAECFQYVREYLRCLPLELARVGMEEFSGDARKLLGLLYVKKKDCDFASSEHIIEATTSIGRLNVNLLFAELQILLTDKARSAEQDVHQKALLCHALGTLAKSHPREVSGYNSVFGPLAMQYMDSKYNLLAVNAIRSFPHVTVNDPTAERSIVRKVAFVVVHEAADIADAAFNSLLAYLMQSPDNLLCPLVTIYLNVLSVRSFTKPQGADDYSAVVAGFAYLHRLLGSYLDALEQAKKPTAVNALEWLECRQHMEGVAIMWLTHTDVRVRVAVIECLRLFSHPVFRYLEESRVPGVSRLVDFLPASEDDADGVWSTHLARFVSLSPPRIVGAPPPSANGAPPPSANGAPPAPFGQPSNLFGAPPPNPFGGPAAPPPRPYGGLQAQQQQQQAAAADDQRPLAERFRVPLEYAWVRLATRFHGALPVLAAGELSAEQVGVWLNYVKFLCVSISHPVEGHDAQQRVPRGRGGSMGAEDDEGPVSVEATDLEEFFAAVIGVAWADGVDNGISAALLNYYELIHPSCIGVAVRVIQSLRQKPPEAVVARRKRYYERRKEKREKAAAESEAQATGWIFYEEVLDLLSRFVTRLMKRHAAAQAAAEGRTSADEGGRAG